MSICASSCIARIDHVVELALAEHELRIDAIAQLHDRVDHLDARRARELAQLAHALVGVAVGRASRLVADVDQDRAAVLGLDLARRALPGELGLEAPT